MRATRFWTGVGWGVVATVAMSLMMIGGALTGLSPMPQPIPMAIALRTLGPGIPKALLMVVAVVSHLAYGGSFAGALALITDRVTVRNGLALGLILWLVMQLVWLPYVGWGAFGASVTPRIAAATLVLHLIYGGAVGWLMDRRAAGVPVTA